MTVMKARNPYTGKYDYEFEVASRGQMDEVCSTLRKNQPAWAEMGVEGRIKVLEQFAKATEEHFDEIYNAISIDTGRKGIAAWEARFVGMTVERIKNHARELYPEIVPMKTVTPGIVASGQYVPYGLVGNISPWNFPIILSTLDSLPALLAGNAVVIKPSEVTPRWVDVFEKIVNQIPELRKVLAFMRGGGETGAELIDRMDCVCFTGSVETGRKITERAGRNFIPAFCELGGKDPAIVLSSANLDVATSTILRSAVMATGQVCMSLERVYVDQKVYDAFLNMMIDKAKKVEINYPDMKKGFVGPFIFEHQPHVVMEQLDEAVAMGATIHCGGEVIDHGGKWMKPTVMTGVNHQMRVMKQETFGPIIPIMPFKTIDEAVGLANDTIYGLSASVYSKTLEEAQPIARRLNAGAVGINDASVQGFCHDVPHMMFGKSGIGSSRFGADGIIRYARLKTILGNLEGGPDINAFEGLLASLMPKE
ncbi:MAG: aldehyde dehydrogenase family protein [Myxococcota bacterium]|nr:aldehyde dehydrogenase family protein [Myxococcota bacterium]